MTTTRTKTVSIPVFWIFLVLLVLKVTGVADIGWVWVFAPLWIPWAIILTIFGLFAAYAMLLLVAMGVLNLLGYKWKPKVTFRKRL